MTDRLLPIPLLPNGLREAAQRGKLVLFVGAACAHPINAPGFQGCGHAIEL